MYIQIHIKVYTYVCIYTHAHTSEKNLRIGIQTENVMLRYTVIQKAMVNLQIKLPNLPSKAVYLGSNSMMPSALSFFIIVIWTVEMFPISGG